MNVELHGEGLSKDEYDRLTRHGRHRLKRPRPVWLPDKKRWTVGAPVNPIEWQILVHSEPARGRKRVSEINVEQSIMPICGQFSINKYTYSESVDRLEEKHLLKCKGGFRRSKRAEKWLFPDLTSRRAGGEWHRNSIRSYVDEVNRLYGCYTYVDRGFYPSTKMPDVILIKPRLVKHTRYYDTRMEPLRWDMENSIYAEFKSERDIREHPGRFERQLERYDGVPLFLQVEAKVFEVEDLLEEHSRRQVEFLDLLTKAESDMVFLTGSGGFQSFKPVLRKIKDAFLETYDRKARLKKTGTDPQGREHYSLILYDSLNAPKNIGQVIPNFADDVEEFADLYFQEKYLGRITTTDYVYMPERKPTYVNKTWTWKKRKTEGSKFRSFSV